MNYILFAGNRHYPRGGVEDMVGIVKDLVDAEILATVLDKVRSGAFYRDDRLWVNAVSVQPDSLGEPRYWEVRIKKTLDDPSLEFCSHKENIEELGSCGIIPMGAESVTYFDNTTDLTFYPLLDPDKRDMDYLP